MLNRQITSNTSTNLPYNLASAGVELGIPDLVAFVRRKWGTIALAILIFLVLGGLYLVYATPIFSAQAVLVIDTRKLEIFGRGDVSEETSVSNARMETELEILRSNQLAEAVVNAYQLTQDSNFMNSGRGGILSTTIGQISQIASSLLNPPTGTTSKTTTIPPAASGDPLKRRAVAILTKNMDIGRVGESFVISIVYTSEDPRQAARIANGIARVYLDDQTHRQVIDARRLTEWLSTRIEELRLQALSPGLTAEEKSAIRLTHESFIQRYTQAIQQQSLPATQARVITEAIVPSGPSSPKMLIVLAASVLLGGVFGVGVAITRDLLDSKIRSRQQLVSAARAPCLGILPMFHLPSKPRRRRAAGSETRSTDGSRTFGADPEFSVSIDAPLSLFAETLRSIKVAADNLADGPAGIIGIVSAAPMEGKTTVAINLARLAGGTSASVLLVDADLRNPTLTRKLVPSGARGLIQAVSDSISFDDILWSDLNTSLQFLPAGTDEAVMNSSEILASGRMKYLMDELQARFDFIVVDLPPLLSVVDVRAAAGSFDGFVFVAEWGVTTRDAVIQAIGEGGIDGRMIGTILNKVLLRKLGRYDSQSYVRLGDGYIDSNRLVG